jgi:hypothetical protein
MLSQKLFALQCFTGLHFFQMLQVRFAVVFIWLCGGFFYQLLFSVLNASNRCANELCNHIVLERLLDIGAWLVVPKEHELDCFLLQLLFFHFITYYYGCLTWLSAGKS